jgi:hypothetical protein
MEGALVGRPLISIHCRRSNSLGEGLRIPSGRIILEGIGVDIGTSFIVLPCVIIVNPLLE